MTDVTTGESSTADTTTTTETSAAATGATASTDAGAELQAQETGTTAEAGAESGAESEVPEQYEFTVPEGMALDEKLVEKATPVLKELGLTNDQANKLVGVYAEHIAELAAGSGDAFEAAYAERRQAEIAQRIERDGEALKEARIPEAHHHDVKRALAALPSDIGAGFREFIDAEGLGNDPRFVRAVRYWAHDYTPTDTGEQPAGAGGSGSQRAPHEILYRS